jgi:hypothetical protein
MRTIDLHSHEYRKLTVRARPQDNPVSIWVGFILSLCVLAYVFGVRDLIQPSTAVLGFGVFGAITLLFAALLVTGYTDRHHQPRYAEAHVAEQEYRRSERY